MAEKYLDKAGVQKLWTKTKEKIVSEISTRAPASHTHPISDITNLQSSLDSKANNTDISNINLKIGTLENFKTSATNQLNGLKKGQANGVASLGSDGKVPSSQLPSYVDDVLEYTNKTSFPATGESGKIYVAKDTNKTYRWSGSAYTEISASLALGTTASTAFPGDRGLQCEQDIDALQSTKSDVGHTHLISDITNLEANLDSWLQKEGGNFSGAKYKYNISFDSQNTPLTISGTSNNQDIDTSIILGKNSPSLEFITNDKMRNNKVTLSLNLRTQYSSYLSIVAKNDIATNRYDVLDSSMALTEEELNAILV